MMVIIITKNKMEIMNQMIFLIFLMIIHQMVMIKIMDLLIIIQRLTINKETQ